MMHATMTQKTEVWALQPTCMVKRESQDHEQGEFLLKFKEVCLATAVPPKANENRKINQVTRTQQLNWRELLFGNHDEQSL